MKSMKAVSLSLVFLACQFGLSLCDGAHPHDAAASHAADTSSVHTTSGDVGAGADGFASLLSGISPELISSLAQNPQVAQALRSSGVDVGAVTAASAAAQAGGTVPPPGGRPGGLPPGLAGLGGLGALGGLGGLGGLPFFGPYKNLHISGDFGAYYPFVEKAVLFFGGGILILVILCLLSKAFAEGGILAGLGSGFSDALAGSASLDLGPFHKSVAGSAAVNAGIGRGGIASTPSNIQLNQRVQDSLDQRF